MQKTPLRTQLILIIAVLFLVSAASVALLFSYLSSRIIEEFALRVATKQALHDKNKIMALIDREVALSLKLSDDAVIRAFLAHPRKDQRTANDALVQLESYRRFFRDQSYFIAGLADRSYLNADRTAVPGHPRRSTLHPDNPMDSWFFNALQRVDTFELNLNWDELIKQIKVWVNVIIRDDQGSKIGVGGTGIALGDFLQEIVHSGEPGTSAILIDHRGIIMAHQDQQLVEQNAREQNVDRKVTIYTMLKDQEDAQHLQQALKLLSGGTKQVVSFPLKYGGRRSVAAVTFMPAINWYTIAVVESNHALQPSVFTPIIAVGVVSLLVVILLITLLLNRLILQPLRLLTEASGEVARGNYAVSLPVVRKDEIGTLTESFNSMAAMVSEYTATLEERVQQRTEELTSANQLLEASQADIMESLHYARVIQSSILPDRRQLDQLFTAWFVLYQPCAVVGGDLYWIRRASENRLLVAVLDCTGHGVPGAFMTMTVNAVLNTVVDTICNDNPSRILQETNRMLQDTLRLRQEGESTVDAGLEIGLCCIDPGQCRLQFAGAGIALWMSDASGVREIKGERYRIGYRTSDCTYCCQNHQVSLQQDTVFYLTTDGLLDESGGPKGYGFGTDRFRQLLTDHRHLSLPEQQQAIVQRLEAWRGSRRQRDDICVLGFKNLKA